MSAHLVVEVEITNFDTPAGFSYPNKRGVPCPRD
jgi:hypothetical protein